MTKQIVQAFELLEAIGGTTSRTAKEDFLKAGEDNNIFKEILVRTYNPDLIYGVKKKVKIKSLPTDYGNLNDNYISYLDLTSKLYNRELTGNAALDALATFLLDCGQKEAEWYMKSIQKDFKIGITAKSINKVFPGLIAEYSCALAKPLKKYPKRYSADRKLDGYRCNGFNYGGGKVVLKSRNGKIITGYTGIEQDIAQLPVGYMYDGEIMAPSGKFADVQKSAFKKSDDKVGILHIFDAVPIHEFEAGESTKILEERIDFLEYIDQQYIQEFPLWNLEWVQPDGIFEDSEESQQKVFHLHRHNRATGYEGTMIKDLDATYKCKRSFDIQKIVDVNRVDLTVVGFEEGKEGTKNEGVLGALVVEYKGNEVSIGGGYTDEMRVDLWARRNELINKVIEIEYREESTNSKTGKKSLRFPEFVRFRPDKE
ncbi:putative ligase [Bacillus phage CP-51]|uniref:DNA ligase n=1 Tax=Bacillus phage CP-51 TaxID=1391188 RepID=A0A068EME7_9CAUD|nr:putative ligase [Bacillus phage CP-51]AID50538.1 putative ligase [Bacillus phage CP-51]